MSNPIFNKSNNGESMFSNNIRMVLRGLIVSIFFAALSGCAVWTRIETATQEGPGGKYKVQAPVGWVRFSMAQDAIMITRDGMPIQYVQVAQQKDEDYFKQTKVKLAANVQPSDLAQLILAEMRSDKSLANLTIKQSVPFVVAGQPGFKVHFQFRNERGTLFDRVVLGTSKGKEVIVMVYHGLNTHYFGRDLETFYGIAKSFQS
jgi:hypothetical protein